MGSCTSVPSKLIIQPDPDGAIYHILIVEKKMMDNVTFKKEDEDEPEKIEDK